MIASEYSELWKSLTSSRPGWPFGYHYCLFLAPYPLIFSLLLLHNKRLYVGEARRTMYCSPLTAEIVRWFSLGGFGTNQNPSSGCLGWKTRRYCLFQDLKKSYCLPKSQEFETCVCSTQVKSSQQVKALGRWDGSLSFFLSVHTNVSKKHLNVTPETWKWHVHIWADYGLMG